MLPPIVVDRLYSPELKSLVDQYYNAYEANDEEMRELLMVELTYNLRQQMEKQVHSYTCLNELYTDYTNACKHILRPEYYDTSVYPEFLINRVVSVIMSECSNTMTWMRLDCFTNRLKYWFKHLKKVGAFNMENVDNIIGKITNEYNSIDFMVGDLHQLCKVLYAIPSYYESLYKLLRFLIMNQLSEIDDPDELYKKKMLYIKYGELTISNYIPINKPSFQCVLYGMYPYEGNELDMIYLKLGKSNDRNNFLIVDYRSDSDEYHSDMDDDYEAEN